MKGIEYLYHHILIVCSGPHEVKQLEGKFVMDFHVGMVQTQNIGIGKGLVW